MSVAELTKRVAELERKVAELSSASSATKRSGKWWIEQSGQFKNDPVYDEIVRRGRKYRESLRPKSGKRSR